MTITVTDINDNPPVILNPRTTPISLLEVLSYSACGYLSSAHFSNCWLEGDLPIYRQLSFTCMKRRFQMCIHLSIAGLQNYSLRMNSFASPPYIPNEHVRTLFTSINVHAWEWWIMKKMHEPRASDASDVMRPAIFNRRACGVWFFFSDTSSWYSGVCISRYRLWLGSKWNDHLLHLTSRSPFTLHGDYYFSTLQSFLEWHSVRYWSSQWHRETHKQFGLQCGWILRINNHSSGITSAII